MLRSDEPAKPPPTLPLGSVSPQRPGLCPHARAGPAPTAPGAAASALRAAPARLAAGGAPPLAAPCGCRGPLARRSPALPPASAARLVLSTRCAAVALTCTRAVWAGTGGGTHARVQTPLGLVVGGGCEAGRLGHPGSPPLRTAARACPRGLARRVAHAAASWRQIRTSVQKAGERAARGRCRGSSCLRLGRTDRPAGLGAPICYHMTGVSKFQLPARVLISI